MGWLLAAVAAVHDEDANVDPASRQLYDFKERHPVGYKRLILIFALIN